MPRFDTAYLFLLALIAHQHFFRICGAWKPISGTAAFTSSFSLQQSHPELGSKREDSIEVASSPLTESHPSSSLSLTSAFPAQDARILTGDILGESSAELPSTLLAFKFEDTDHFGYSHPSSLLSTNPFEQKRCAVKKFAFNHDGVVEYEHQLPELTQFTICFWTRFTNHSGDHVILTYADDKKPRALQFWIANSLNSSFISMAIKGQQIYRLNYPLKMRQWHHTCSSWNGKTGEWQVWMKAERIGRGFQNSLVGHKIPANGKLFSGGPSVTGQVSQGLHFEITFVQIYRIALSAGKAHRNHKHHHVHHFDHEGQELQTTTRPPPVIKRPQAMSPLLANGQIPTQVRINLAQPQAGAAPAAGASNAQRFGFRNPSPQAPNAAMIHTNFVNGQINGGSRLVAQQLLGIQSNLNLLPRPAPTLPSASNVQFVDETETRIFFKRQAEAKQNITKSALHSGTETAAKNVKKRELVLLDDGSIISDNAQHSINDVADYAFDGLAGFGGQQFKHDLNVKMNIEEEVSIHDREPAEEEVRAVMLLCSSCDIEPFQGAIVFAWKHVVENMNNVLKGNSVGGCGDF